MFVCINTWGDDATSPSSWANSDLASITQAAYVSSTTGADGSIGAAYGIKTAAGSVGNTTVTTAVSELRASGVFALKEASSEDVLNANDVESASNVSSPVITQEHVITATSVETTSETLTVDLSEIHVLSGTSVESASELTTPIVAEGAHTLTANDVESASQVLTVTLGQEHGLTSTDVESASELTTPAIAGTHVLTVLDPESASEVTSPVIGQTHVILADDAESSSEVTVPSLDGVAAAFLPEDSHGIVIPVHKSIVADIVIGKVYG
jgi:putative methionine-R-sulfoxide reductase with GAF domain